jgi:hypothetical protein
MDDNFLYPYTLSDESLKTNVQELDSLKSLIFILSLQAKSFLYNKRQSIGFIAQDVEKINRHCVITTTLREKGSQDKSYLSLSYNEIFVHCTNSFKSLVDLIDTQNKKIAELTLRIEELEKKFDESSDLDTEKI